MNGWKHSPAARTHELQQGRCSAHLHADYCDGALFRVLIYLRAERDETLHDVGAAGMVGHLHLTLRGTVEEVRAEAERLIGRLGRIAAAPESAE